MGPDRSGLSCVLLQITTSGRVSASSDLVESFNYWGEFVRVAEQYDGEIVLNESTQRRGLRQLCPQLHDCIHVLTALVLLVPTGDAFPHMLERITKVPVEEGGGLIDGEEPSQVWSEMVLVARWGPQELADVGCGAEQELGRSPHTVVMPVKWRVIDKIPRIRRPRGTVLAERHGRLPLVIRKRFGWKRRWRSRVDA